MKKSIITEELSRIKSLMGLVSEVVDISDDSYITMTIKNFPKYKKEISDLLQNKLKSSNGDFVKFKDLVRENQTKVDRLFTRFLEILA